MAGARVLCVFNLICLPIYIYTNINMYSHFFIYFLLIFLLYLSLGFGRG